MLILIYDQTQALVRTGQESETLKLTSRDIRLCQVEFTAVLCSFGSHPMINVEELSTAEIAAEKEAERSRKHSSVRTKGEGNVSKSR